MVASPPMTTVEPRPNSSGDKITACVLIIGNEILSGRTQDTNLNHLAATLGDWGIQVTHARVIPDDERIIIDTVREVSAAYNYVFTTGGIGPTHDDITAECMAKAFGQPLIEHPDIAVRIRQRPAPEEVMQSRLRMARVPAEAELIDNPTGGPQGFRVANVHVMAGIPAVMQAMLSTLEDKLDHGAIVHSYSVTAFLGESQIADALSAIQDDYPSCDIGSYPFFRNDRYGTSLVIRGTDEATLSAALAAVQQAIIDAGEEPHDITTR